jgi:4-hydroxy-tetrahydrodipicolinate reductase
MTRGLAIVGHGKMGRLIEQLAPEFGFDVRLALKSCTNSCAAGLTRENLRAVDVAVEFSTPSAAAQNIRQLAALGIPVVAGTTGWLHDFP